MVLFFFPLGGALSHPISIDKLLRRKKAFRLAYRDNLDPRLQFFATYHKLYLLITSNTA
jgi:hypothetical protein